MFDVPTGPHVGGQPLSGLTARQKQAVSDLGISEEEWDTCTWQFREHEFSKLKQAEGMAAVALGFDPTSWFLFGAIVRSKYTTWLNKIKDQKRAQENKIASSGEAASAPKRVSPGASSSKAAASLSARPQKAAPNTIADEVLQGAAVAASATAPPPQNAGKRGVGSRRKGGAASNTNADDILQGAAVLDGATVPPTQDAGPSHTLPYQPVPHHAIPCHTIPYPTIS